MVAFRLPGTSAALADATLLLETVCPACQGAGVVGSAHWQMFHAFYRRWRDRNPKPARSAPQAVRADWLLGHDAALTAWWQGEGFDPQIGYYPPEEEPCPGCAGAGTVLERLTLAELAALLGTLRPVRSAA